jgi:hypothetical protein
MAAKLIKTLQEFDPGRFKITIAGNDDEFYIKIIENYSYSGEGSEEIDSCRTIFEGFSEDLVFLEEQACKVIRKLKP